jgi:hypothetical protein
VSRFGSPKRTQADRDRDLVLFCGQARIEAVRGATAADLAHRYGCDRKLAEYHRTMRLQREDAA